MTLVLIKTDYHLNKIQEYIIAHKKFNKQILFDKEANQDKQNKEKNEKKEFTHFYNYTIPNFVILFCLNLLIKLSKISINKHVNKLKRPTLK